MRKNIYPLLLLLGLAACSESDMDELAPEVIKPQLTEVSNDHGVHFSDIKTLSNAQYPKTRSGEETVKLECLTSPEKDTLLYVCKKQSGGWTIYSSDTRVPAIVAESDSGSFDDLMKIEGARLWIEGMKQDMALIRTLEDDKLNFTKQEIENNRKFWKSISSPDDFIKKQKKSTRASIIDPSRELIGHYELVRSESHTETVLSTTPLITTSWHQGDPYNILCPVASFNPLKRAPAGCVAIAAAQMLYFLHDSLHVPAAAPSDAYFAGTIYDYEFHVSQFSTTIWNNMDPDGLGAASLIAFIGYSVGMDYGTDSSGAQTSNLVQQVFAPFGISCAYAEYNPDLVKLSLVAGMPVILSARSYDIFNLPNTYGHTFITDRYKITRLVTKNVYEWVWDSNPSSSPLEQWPDREEYVYSSPEISMIGMNWGWGDYDSYPEHNNGWYGLVGNWTTYSKDKNLNTYFDNWNIQRHMIWGFHVAQ